MLRTNYRGQVKYAIRGMPFRFSGGTQNIPRKKKQIQLELRMAYYLLWKEVNESSKFANIKKLQQILEAKTLPLR